jgi:competence protein ComEC
MAPWLTARVPAPDMLVVGVYYGALAVAVACSRRATRMAAAIVLLAATLVVAGVADPSAMVRSHDVRGRLRLTMFDVGQGEAVLLQMPDGDRMLVDAGGTPFGGAFDIGARVLAPALWARGVRSLDTLLITHGDPDHLGGALDVLGDFAPRRLSMGVVVEGHRPTGDVLDAARRSHVPIDLRRAGQATSSGEVHVRVLHPPEPDWERRNVRNDDSIVLELHYGDVAILLTGDISAEVERALLPRLTSARTRVLKVAHHGSRTSTSRELLESWRPQIAIVSAGRGNTFGHPAAEVLQRLEAVGATVLRTDRHGQITLETDGEEVRWRVFRPD